MLIDVLIKFRAWHKEEKILGPVRRINYEFETVDILVDPSYPECIYDCPFEDVELMQSSAMIDVRGKEIFEGDIVQTRDRHLGLVSSLMCDSMRPVRIFTDKINYNLDLFGPLTVIGNRYENPYLLEVKK